MITPSVPLGAPRGSLHAVQLYEGEAFLTDTVAGWAAEGLAAGEAAVIIAGPEHRAAVEATLRARGVDVAALEAEGRWVVLDAAHTLGRVLRDGYPDAARFRSVAAAAIVRAGCAGRPVRVFGEMVALLWAQGDREAAIRLETLWNELAATLSFSLLCAYPLQAFRRGDAEPLRRVCDAHTHVLPEGSDPQPWTEEQRLRFVTRFQQRALAIDAETARQREERRQASEMRAFLAAIVESSEDAIVGKTLDGIVTSWNAGAERLFGYPAAEMIGQHISRLVPPGRQDDVAAILGAVRRGERVEHFETERVRRDGRRIHVSLTVSPIRDAAGRVVGASKIARDVSDRKQAEAERERLLALAESARADAESANRAKDEFLAMLGHELRNPLSAVRNAVVAAQLDASRRDRALEIARRGVDSLGRLVDDLLDVARITHGRIVLRRQSLSFVSVVERAVDSMRPFVEERAHRLTVTLPSEDLLLDGDATRLEQVVANLLTNAAKYTPHGGELALSVRREEDEAVLRVRDSGIGIETHMLPRVFDLFAQADRSPERAQGGLGIGLTLVRKLTEMHGGRVEAHSEGVGRGAEFVVRLPLLEPSYATPATTPALEARAPTPRCARVLLIEDNPDAADSLMLLLQVLGHRVRVAHDGLSGLEAARADVPDVVLIDIGLPGMDGHEVARRFRRDPALRHLELVALTGYGREEDRERALAAGFDHHLAKPVDLPQLERIVLRHVPAVAPGTAKLH